MTAGPTALPGLRWSVKVPFLRYIARSPEGRCSVTDGASVVDEHMFLFSPDDASAFDAGTVTGLLKFRGDVRFAAHYGLLFLRIADPWLSVTGGAGTLTIAAPPGQSPERIPLTTLHLRTADPTDHADSCLGTHVRLTAQGSELFNGVYPVDEPFDDLTLLLTPSSTTALEKTP
ncbi:HtaA domain-containing protein [Streptomyces sp. SD31]|uniref:HtaA domain-containing protein n=1 Tax=Streptomyces sp. SD31 TaxID=3452208 RepID=UPI003F8BDD4D